MTEQSNNKVAIEQYRSRYQDAVKLLAAGQVQESVLACRSLCESIPNKWIP